MKTLIIYYIMQFNIRFQEPLFNLCVRITFSIPESEWFLILWDMELENMVLTVHYFKYQKRKVNFIAEFCWKKLIRNCVELT